MNGLLAALLREKLALAGLSVNHTVGGALEWVQVYIRVGGTDRHPWKRLIVAEAALQAALASGVPDSARLTAQD